MTFNRYILFRMVVEFVGAIACAIQMFQHHTWPGIITMGVFALVWAVGEIWLSTVYNRAHPDATSCPTSIRQRPSVSRSSCLWWRW